MIDTKAPPTPSPAKKRKWLIPAVLLAVLALAAGGGLFWFFAGDAPAEVDLAATASSVEGDITGASDGIEGDWTVDTSVGEFTVADTTTSTFVGFRVEEVLSGIGSATAVGRTPDVVGSLTIEGTTLTEAAISAELTTIVSDESRREDSIQRALNTSVNREATFVLTEPIELGDGAAAGDPVSVTAVGELTVNGVTNTVAIDLEAQLVDGMILVTGTAPIVFADYDVTTPTSPAVLSVEDQGVVEIQLWLSR